MLNQNTIRTGFVRIKRVGGRWIEFVGMPVLGRSSKTGGAVNRRLLADCACPLWFTNLCKKHEGTPFQIEVKTVSLVRGDLAFVAPVAENLEEALSAWQLRRGETVKPEVKEHTACLVDTDYAFKAHTYVAEKNGLRITTHCEEGERSYSCAINGEGKLFKVSGGIIVGKLRDGIEAGRLKWEIACERFIRVRPLSV